MRSYIINLDRSTDRLGRMAAQFDAFGVAYERVSAIDGTDLRADQIDAEYWPRPPRRSLSRPEIACFLSHRLCWKRIAEGPDAFACIFEDDVELSPRLPAVLQGNAWIPADADIVRLETYGDRSWVDRRMITLDGGLRLGRLRSYHRGSAGYIVSPAAAQRLLDATKRFSRATDRTMFHPEDGLGAQFVVYQFLPALCAQRMRLYDAGTPAHTPSTVEEYRIKQPFVPQAGRRPRKVNQNLDRLRQLLSWRCQVNVPFDTVSPSREGQG